MSIPKFSSSIYMSKLFPLRFHSRHPLSSVLFKILISSLSVFSFPVSHFAVITSLISVMLVNGGPVCPPPSSHLLPLVKLPVGYYRDVFINAVYESLSALFLRCIYLLIFHTYLPLAAKMTSFFIPFFLFPVCRTVFSFICPFLPVPLPFLWFHFVEISLFC